MKTKIKIIAMLISMLFVTLVASGQSAKRGSSEQKKTTSTAKAYKNPAQKSHTPAARQSQPTRQPQATSRAPQKNVQRGSSVQREAVAQNPRSGQANRSTNVQTQRADRSPASTAQRENHQKMSTTTRTNPKSNYRVPEKTVHVGKTYSDPKPAGNSNSSSGNHGTYSGTNHSKTVIVNHGHSHNYYPARKVKVHVHPMTYRGDYRALYYPRYTEIVWTRSMHRNYITLYPGYTGWHYNFGYRIQTMSVFDARFNVGEVARVYGRVYATWYNNETDDLLLFFGGEYPYQEFTMVLPGSVARRYSWRPERYFLGQHVAATGLITTFDGKAEMVVKRRSQIDIY